MRYRKVRIVWSAAWGVVALLLCLLWVRSYWWMDLLAQRIPSFSICVQSVQGRSVLSGSYNRFGDYPYRRDTAHQCYADEPGNWTAWEKSNPPFWDYHTDGSTFWLTVPGWFVALIALTMAFGGWVPLRFSLRTLLIAATLACVGLGLAVYFMRR